MDFSKCPSCHRKTNGVEDFYSNLKNSTAIRKTCRQCRTDSYTSYRKKHPLKKKEIIIPEKNTTQCKTCKKFNTMDYYIGTNNRQCKTCKYCRDRVLKSVNKNKKETLTQKKKLNIMKDFINTLDPILINPLIKKALTA